MLLRDNQEERQIIKIYFPLKKQNSQTFAKWYSIRKDGKERENTIITKLPEMFYSAKLLHRMRIDEKLTDSLP
jgi:hypothetical protein